MTGRDRSDDHAANHRRQGVVARARADGADCPASGSHAADRDRRAAPRSSATRRLCSRSDECLTYRSARGTIGPICALGARARGLAKGEAVCLLMPNRPEYMAIWLGITRVGGVVALLNTNLDGPSLAHCINVAAPRHLIVDAELIDRLTARAQRPRRRADDLGARWRRAPTSFRASIDDDRAMRRRRAAAERRAPAGDDRRSRALHLHLRHDRAAQSRHRQPCAADAVEPLVCRADGRAVRATACTTACRCITASAACSRPAPSWSAAARW